MMCLVGPPTTARRKPIFLPLWVASSPTTSTMYGMEVRKSICMTLRGQTTTEVDISGEIHCFPGRNAPRWRQMPMRSECHFRDSQ